MFSRVANGLRSQSGKRLLRNAQQQTTTQRRNMGGGGAWLETNKFGENVGEVFGTVAWLWVFHRFNQDGAVLLGLAHPWDHGHDDHGHGHGHAAAKKLKPEEKLEMWQKFSDKSVVPGEDDDDDDDDDDDEEE